MKEKDELPSYNEKAVMLIFGYASFCTIWWLDYNSTPEILITITCFVSVNMNFAFDQLKYARCLILAFPFDCWVERPSFDLAALNSFSFVLMHFSSIESRWRTIEVVRFAPPFSFQGQIRCNACNCMCIAHIAQPAHAMAYNNENDVQFVFLSLYQFTIDGRPMDGRT